MRVAEAAQKRPAGQRPRAGQKHTQLTLGGAGPAAVSPLLGPRETSGEPIGPPAGLA